MSLRETGDVLTIVGLAVVTWGTARQAKLDLDEYRDLFGRVPLATGKALVEQLPLGRGKFWRGRDLSSHVMRATRIGALVIGVVSLVTPGGLTSYISSVVEDVPNKMVDIPDDEMATVKNAAESDAKRAVRLIRGATSWFLIMIGSIVGIVASSIVLYLDMNS